MVTVFQIFEGSGVDWILDLRDGDGIEMQPL